MISGFLKRRFSTLALIQFNLFSLGSLSTIGTEAVGVDSRERKAILTAIEGWRSPHQNGQTGMNTTRRTHPLIPKTGPGLRFSSRMEGLSRRITLEDFSGLWGSLTYLPTKTRIQSSVGVILRSKSTDLV